jgi:hypothetical protein
MPNTPRTEQREAARKRALEVREEQRAIFRGIKARRISLAALLREDPPSCIRRVLVHKLLTTQPYYQDRRFREVMEEASAGFAKTVEEMTERQLRIVARDVEEWEKTHPIAAEEVAA